MADCCARATTGHAAALPNHAMNVRLFIDDLVGRQERFRDGEAERLAVLRLIANSYLVVACTGKSAGFSPLRMRST
jgi:hypothetical protein